jgi:ABC-type nitrate/sulfonate/bicarbonate transport system substrate-binding protein
MKLAIPDLVSNSYFPAIAAIDLGCFADQGLDVALELIFPVDAAYRALKDGAVDFVGGTAHAALAAFPGWDGVKLLCAQGQGMYWFLVMRADLGARRGDIACVKGQRIAAAPWVEMGLRRMLDAEGIDPARDGVEIVPVPPVPDGGTSFGTNAAKALEAGLVDGFWANGMGAEVAVQRGVGSVVLDVRRGDGPAGAFDYTFSAVAATDRLIAETPDAAAAAVRAVTAAHRALRAEPERAAAIGRKRFPELEAGLITELIRRDLPYYDATLSPETVASLNGFACTMGILEGDVPYDDVVATSFKDLWKESVG